MEKKAAIINDELGTIALGFSRSGYEISAIYIERADQNALSVCEKNWGNQVYSVDWDDFSLADFADVDFIAGKMRFPAFATAANRDTGKVDNNILKIAELLNIKRPRVFLFQYNRISPQNQLFQHFLHQVREIGYQFRYDWIDVRLFTGFPVNEKECFISGILGASDNVFELSPITNTVNYLFDDFYETQFMDDEQCYSVNPKFLSDIEKEHERAILCWHNGHYKEEPYVAFNPKMIPLVAWGDKIRKLTHREVARLKGIPDEYSIDVSNKTWLYQKLMYSANVLLIQQMVSAFNLAVGGSSFQQRAVSKGLQFEKIIKAYFTNKDDVPIIASENVDRLADFQFETDAGIYKVILKLYSGNVGIEAKLLAVCERIKSITLDDNENYIVIVGNMISTKLKERIKRDFKIHIWDVKNLFWLFEEFPSIKSEFISLLSYTVSNIEAQKPELNIFEKKSQKLYNLDLQERLRKIRPGKEEAQNYEKLCAEILRYIFSEDLEFFEEQKRSNDGLYRFDYCGKIKAGQINKFFDTVRNFFHTKYIIFEFKNYSDEITQKEIYTTEKYLYETALRKVAVIISRKGANMNARRALRGSLRESGKLIICLSDEHINKLIEMKSNSGSPGDMLEDMLDDMLMELEK